MDRLNCERALHRRQRADTGVGAFQFLHDKAIRRVAHRSAAMLFEVWRVKAQRAHARNKMVWESAGAMARNDLGQDFLLHKLRGPIAYRSLFIGEKFFDFVVIERVHFVPIWLMRASLA